MPFPVSRSQISASSALSRTIRAARWGTATYPCPVSRSVRSSVGSRPLLGEAVTVTVRSTGTCSSSLSSIVAVGSTSYRVFCRSRTVVSAIIVLLRMMRLIP